MKYFFILSLLMVNVAAFANDEPCQVDLYKSQSQFTKVLPRSNDKNIERLLNQKNISLPEVMAKADRFKIIKQQPQEQVVQQTGPAATEQDEANESPSKLGGMFELLIPAKLRNPAR